MIAEAEEASTRLEAYLKRRPESGRGWANLGTVSLAAEDDAKAARAFRKALDLGYRKADTSYNLACAYARMKQKDEAFAWLDRAIAAGYTSWRHMEEDDDLYNLRRDPRFDRAVEKARKAARRAGEED
jgi:tetratricopeptide (TPR) repeat protein